MATTQTTDNPRPGQVLRAFLGGAAGRAHRLAAVVQHPGADRPAQKFAASPISEWLIAAMGGIESVRIIHRIAAVTIVLMSVYHVIVLGYKIWVRRVEMSMLPGLKDLTDALDLVRYNLGLSKEHPKMPRYNFGEKVEYWAMVWGTVVMAITGFMLWNPISTTRFLPGQFIPAAKAAHGGEAVLAVLAIIIWHFYNVHAKLFNRSMFTGKMKQHQMAEEHGEELEQRLAGKTRPAPDPAGVKRRERIYLPVAIVLALIGIFAVYQFATFEQTAIATLPAPVERQEVFTPLTPTPGPSVTQVAAALIPHPIKGQEQCDTCHGPNGMKPFPADHAGRPNESCTVCHLPGPTPVARRDERNGRPGGRSRANPAPDRGRHLQGLHDVPRRGARSSRSRPTTPRSRPIPAPAAISRPTAAPRVAVRQRRRKRAPPPPAAEPRGLRRSRTRSRATPTRTARRATAKGRSSRSRRTTPRSRSIPAPAAISRPTAAPRVAVRQRRRKRAPPPPAAEPRGLRRSRTRSRATPTRTARRATAKGRSSPSRPTTPRSRRFLHRLP